MKFFFEVDYPQTDTLLQEALIGPTDLHPSC